MEADLDQVDQAEEIERCRADPWYFITQFCKTNDEVGNVQPFPDHEYLRDVYDRWNVKGVPTVDTKSAQNMITWLSACVHLSDILLMPGIMNGYFSIGQFESSKVKDRVEFIIDQLPEWFLAEMGLAQIKDSAKEVQFDHGDGVKSTIVFMHSGEKAGRSLTFYRCTLDEFGFMQNAKKIYNGVKTRNVYLNTFSTPPETKTDWFSYLYHHAYEFGVSTDKIHYSRHPDKKPGTERGDAWKERKKRGMTDEEWDREQECKWIALAGRVYPTFDRSTHVVKPINDFTLQPDWEFFRGIDFGWGHPFVHLWVARIKCGSFSRWYIFFELYKEELLLKDAAALIHKVDDKKRPMPGGKEWHLKGKYTKEISDAAGKREREELRRVHKIKTQPSRKHPGSVRVKINKVKEALQMQMDGLPGLVVSEKCPKTIFEFENYVWKNEVEDGEHEQEPKKVYDHAMDVIGDIIYTVESKENDDDDEWGDMDTYAY